MYSAKVSMKLKNNEVTLSEFISMSNKDSVVFASKLNTVSKVRDYRVVNLPWADLTFILESHDWLSLDEEFLSFLFE